MDPRNQHKSNSMFFTPSGFSNQDVFKACREKDAERLRSVRRGNITDLSYKILAVAALQTHCSTENITLEEWNDALRPGPVAPYDNMINGAVSLVDFYRAHQYAENDVEDPLIAKNISDYVKAHKSVLFKLLKHPRVEIEADALQDMSNRFGDLTLTDDAKFTMPKKPTNNMADFLIQQLSEFAARMSGVEVDSSVDEAEKKSSPRP